MLTQKGHAVSLEWWKNLPIIEEPLVLQESTVSYDEPLIKLMDNIIQDALGKSASDIHIEPYQKNCRIRFRQDGLLHEVTSIPHSLAERITTRLKVMAKLDISERRLPQDGRFQLNDYTIDVRINTCPTLFGEKIVLRLLDTRKLACTIDNLGLNNFQKIMLQEKILRPQGLILVTGPTGSGKTMTLYSILSSLNSTEKNISTVEDPVEIQLHGINQVGINPKIGLCFATVLRTLLRQDPDVIMIGEIRDTETAKIAIQAAQTGHLVLSTLHTKNAIETIARLHAIGISLESLASSLSLIIAQRLVRKQCLSCHSVTPHCPDCLYGYHGRTGIYEFLSITEDIAQLIVADSTLTTLKHHLQNNKFFSLYDAGIEKVASGITSLAEINRVCTNENT